MRKQKSSHQLTPSLNAQPAALKIGAAPGSRPSSPWAPASSTRSQWGRSPRRPLEPPQLMLRDARGLIEAPLPGWPAAAEPYRYLPLYRSIAGPLHVACTCMHIDPCASYNHTSEPGCTGCPGYITSTPAGCERRSTTILRLSRTT